MTEGTIIAALAYVHIVSLSLWFGGLFAYVAIVWPAVMHEADGAFPRAMLARIGMRTGPWIYLGMSTAVLSLAGIWLMDDAVRTPWLVVYALLLAALVANNVYGSVIAWPRIMLLPQRLVRREWFWFRVRMGVSLVVGLALFSVAVITT